MFFPKIALWLCLELWPLFLTLLFVGLWSFLMAIDSILPECTPIAIYFLCLLIPYPLDEKVITVSTTFTGWCKHLWMDSFQSGSPTSLFLPVRKRKSSTWCLVLFTYDWLQSGVEYADACVGGVGSRHSGLMNVQSTIPGTFPGDRLLGANKSPDPPKLGYLHSPTPQISD